MDIGFRYLVFEQFPIRVLTNLWIGIERPIEKMIGDQRIGLTPGMVTIAGPGVLLRGGHHVGGDRVEFDIPVTGQQIGVGIDQAGLVSAFPQGAATAVGLVDIGNVQPADVLQDLGDAPICMLLGQQQVDVIGHQAIGMEFDVITAAALPQNLKVILVVVIGEETGIAVVAALDHVRRDAR